MYFDGEGVPKDNKKAFYWWTNAAEKGHASAQYKLGKMYYDGIETQRDRGKAAYWWAKAAEQGDFYAPFDLGMLYYEGRGVIQSYKSAYLWYGLAAKYLVATPGFLERKKRAEEYRDLSAKKLSPLQIVEVQEILNEMQDRLFGSQN